MRAREGDESLGAEPRAPVVSIQPFINPMIDQSERLEQGREGKQKIISGF